ncbi:hypothetical protein FISHEDRAFT_41065 [Fistulina hepatica ATCC 64428]|nr:hypothetical protein FISHEDRAFT_41065 [Fistulina hepatica ATCC 64428]
MFSLLGAASAQFGNFFDTFFHQQQQRDQQQVLVRFCASSSSSFAYQHDPVSCSRYLCPASHVCVNAPSECPCPDPQDIAESIKCTVPDTAGLATVVCVRRKDGCEQLESLLHMP